MIIDKTKFGLPLFDDIFGGVYRDRMILCCGKSDSGKSMFATYFLNQGISDNDNTLLLTVHSAEDVIIIGECLGFPFSHAVESGLLTILEYNSFISDQNASDNAFLPPDAFLQLERLIENKSIRRIVFDTVIPWVAITPPERISQHVFSFSRAISRLHMTALLTLPKPVSNAARTLKNRLDDVCPISMTLDKSPEGNQTFNVTKYIGQEEYLSTPIPFTMSPRNGICPKMPNGQMDRTESVMAAKQFRPPESSGVSGETLKQAIPAPAIAEGLPFPFPPPPAPLPPARGTDAPSSLGTVPNNPAEPAITGPVPHNGNSKERISFSDAIKFPPV